MDYYEILGISKTATPEEIKKAFRQQAMKHHPDKNPGNKEAEEKFKKINEAYEILKDENKKAAYDRQGHDNFKANQQGGYSDFNEDPFSSFSDIFGDIFGFSGKKSTTTNTRGADLKYNCSITLEEAYKGKEQIIKYRTACECDQCNGSGSKDKTGYVNCNTCHGSGRIRVQQGFFIMERTCNACEGSGKTIKNPCGNCAGKGRVEKQKEIKITIPKGVDEGTKIKVAGAGEAGIMGGKSGDLYVFIVLKKHHLYTRDNHNLHCEVPIKMTTAALGGVITMPGLDGNMINITVPQGTQNASTLKLKSKGMPIIHRDGHGDLIIHVKVEIPTKLTKKQQELLEEFDQICNQSNNPQSHGFFKRIKDLWSDITGG